MDTGKKELNITLSSRECKVLSFVFFEHALKNKHVIPFASFEFSFSLNVVILNERDNIMLTFFTTLYEKVDAANKIELATLTSRHVYFIANYEEAVTNDSAGNIIIPDKLFAVCSSMAISEIRGIYSVKLEDTAYSNAVVPLMDGDLFIPKKQH
jgi:hypothetical protein